MSPGRSRRDRGGAAAPGAPPAPPGRRAGARAGAIVPALVAALVWLAAWAPQLLGGRVLVGGDWLHDLPYSEFSATRWRELHERTFWNPYAFAGVAAAASLADSRPQYLPGPLLDALDALDRLPVWPPLVLPLLAHLAGMLAAAALARTLWRSGPWASAWAAAAWGLVPFQVVPFAFGHHAQLVSVGLMPVALLAAHALFARERLREATRAALWLALVAGVQIAAGHPQFAYGSLVLTGAFGVERAVAFRRGRRLGLAAGAALLGIGLATAVWWPMSLYGADSIRAGGVYLEEVSRYSLAPRDLLVFAWPGAMGRAGDTYWGGLAGTDFPQFFGAIALLFASLGWRRSRDDRAALLLAAAFAVGAVLSLGVHLGPLYAWIHAHVPLWSRFRVPVAPLVVAQLAVALLGARGLDAALGSRPARRAIWGAAAVAALATAAALAVFPAPLERAVAARAAAARPGFTGENGRAAGRVARASLVTEMAIVGGACAAAAFGGPAAGPVLVALAALDPGLVSVPLLRAQTAGRGLLNPPTRSRLARLTAAEPGQRAFSTWMPEAVGGWSWVSWRVPWAGGSHGTPPLRWAELVGSGLLLGAPTQRALAVRYVSTPAADSLPSPDYERAGSDESGFAIWRLRETRPRAWGVRSVRVPGNDVAVMRAMAAGDSFPARVAYAIEPAAAGDYPGSDGLSIGWAEDAPDRVALDLAAPDAAFLVLADAWSPGWRASLDAAPVPIHRVNHMLRGVAVPPGRHRLVMTYEPPGWRAGVSITRTLAVAWLGLLAATVLPVRRRSPPAPDAPA